MAFGLDRLRKLTPPPPSAEGQPDWKAAEPAFGSAFPLDYKQLVEFYGAGSFDEFLSILVPMHPNRHLDLLAQREVQLDALRILRDGEEEVPFDIDRGEEEIVPWAITDNGDVVYWIRWPPASPDDWPVVVNEARGPEWETFDGPATAFLADVLAKQRRLDIFPEDFPSDDPEFVPASLPAA